VDAYAGFDDGPSVLIVDHDEEGANGLAWLLRDDGYAVAVAHGVAAGLEWLRFRPFDALVVDLELPGRGGGAELLRRGADLLSATAIVAVAARTVAEPEPLWQLGARRIFYKPIAYDQLVGALRHALAVGAPPSGVSLRTDRASSGRQTLSERAPDPRHVEPRSSPRRASQAARAPSPPPGDGPRSAHASPHRP